MRTMSLLGLVCSLSLGAFHAEAAHPNILLILADDLGYGDVGCYNPESKVPTPHMDALARQGMRFTDAHSASTVCTPTRYSVMTGRMAFRTGQAGVFVGVQGPCLIKPERLTLPELLKARDYETALFGKWHIGMTFRSKDDRPVYELLPELKRTAKGRGAVHVELVRQTDLSRPATDGPIHHGFDHFFGTVCCPTTDWLYAYVDGDRVPVPPTKLVDKSALPTHPYSFDCRPGLIAPDFDMEEVDMVFLEKSQAFLENHARTKPGKPFFLFHSAQAVHLPSFPGEAFKGKTDAGPHGDFIFEFDHVVGELMKTLDRLGLADNTLVIVTSDNGPEVGTVLNMRSVHNHDGARPWRGVKRDQWEGGHRVPFIVRWPSRVKAGTTSDQAVCLTDIMATCAAIVGEALPETAAEDSYNILPILLGQQEGPLRPFILHQTIRLALAIRRGPWKYLDHKGSGGNSYDRNPGLKALMLPEKAPDAPGQLYNLEDDPGETTNLYNEYPELVKELKALLDQCVESGRSVARR